MAEVGARASTIGEFGALVLRRFAGFLDDLEDSAVRRIQGRHIGHHAWFRDDSDRPAIRRFQAPDGIILVHAVHDTPQDAAIPADGVLRARVHRGEPATAVRQVLVDVDEDDVLLPCETVRLGLPPVPAFRGDRARWKEVVGRNHQGPQDFSIQFIGLPGDADLDGVTLPMYGEGDGLVARSPDSFHGPGR
jgi:hypothetical protein